MTPSENEAPNPELIPIENAAIEKASSADAAPELPIVNASVENAASGAEALKSEISLETRVNRLECFLLEIFEKMSESIHSPISREDCQMAIEQLNRRS